MRLSYYILLPILLFSFSGFGQQVTDKLAYLGQKAPTTTPEVFAPEIISTKSEYEFGSVFNKAGTAFYYGVDTGGTTEIRYTALKNNRWSKPKTILSHDAYGFNDPFLSPDETRLYFISQRSSDGKGAKQDHDIWYVEKQGETWSTPINAGPNINTENDEYYISFTNNGTMYFSSNKKNPNYKQRNFNIYKSDYKNGAFQKATLLSDAVNSPYYEADVFIDPNEKYIIFCARRPDGLGRGDLYISFKNPDDTWTKSVNMGEKINTKGHELCPYVSHDGKYFFYTSNRDIYWVSTEIFKELRNKS